PGVSAVERRDGGVVTDPVPRILRPIRVAPQCIELLLQCLGAPPYLREGGAQARVCLRYVRATSDGLAEFGDRLVVPACEQERLAQSHACPVIAREPPDALPQRGNRSVPVLLCREFLPQQFVRLGVVRVQRDRLVTSRDGVIVGPEAPVSPAQARVEVGAVGPQHTRGRNAAVSL